MNCEFTPCQVSHDGSYGSGRFCSIRCARAFSTAEKRKQINEKVSKTLSRNKTLADLYYKNIITKEMILDACQKSKTWSELTKRLNVSRTSSIVFAQRLIKEWNIDTSHFTGHAHNPEERLRIRPNESKGKLWLYLTKIGREYKCVECGLGDYWNSKKITLHVDHINGVNYDHRPENLRFLCPNCHSQTDTFSWKNAKRKK